MFLLSAGSGIHTHEAESQSSDFRGDVVDAGDRRGVDEAVLGQGGGTGTFFSASRTTQSRPRRARAVSPQVLTALKAY